MAVIDDLSSSKITLIGPKTEMVSLLCSKFSVEHYAVDTRAPRINYQAVLGSYIKAKSSSDHIIISPFVFPVFTFVYLLKKGIIAKKIIRTDEGVGTYASISHYYNAYKLEAPDASLLHCFLNAALKKLAMQLTVLSGLCETQYIFNKHLIINQEHKNKIIRNIEAIGKLDDLEGEVIYVSQPNVEKNFSTFGEYALFIQKIGRSFCSDRVVVKKHPSDNFDYISYGFRVEEGLPLEVYNVESSIIFGFSSTALLTAKVIGGCPQVYYLKISDGILTYDSLSDFNQRLFEHYLTPHEQ